MRTVNASLFWKMYQNVKKSSLLSKGVKDNVKLFIKELNYPKQWVICWKNQQRLQFANKWGGGGVLWLYTLKNSPGIYRFVTLHLEIPEEAILSLEILQNCMMPLGNSKIKNHDPWKFHMSQLL